MTGPAPAADELAFRSLTEKIARERQFACGSYKDRCLQRRIAVRMRACRVSSYRAYARHLDAHPEEWERLMASLTINVTRFFRNRDVFEVLARSVIPPLWAGSAPVLRVWSAGCASGEEAVTLAILFDEHARTAGEATRVAGRVRVLGSDVDSASVDAARAGRYDERSFTETPPGVRASYFSAGTPSTVSPAIQSLIRFERRDLLSEDPPAGPFHLIACRNVLIYLDRAAQEQLLARCHALLAPGGSLVLGKSETLFGLEQRRLFEAVDARARVFRRR